MKDPFFKIRYASGLGDIIKCILHSKLIGPITKLITKQETPCSACLTRAQALNILFPLDLWWLFFKSKEDQKNQFIKDAIAYGYEVGSCEQKQEEKNNLEESLTQQSEELRINNFNSLEENASSSNSSFINEDNLVQKIETSLKDYNVVISFYKKH